MKKSARSPQAPKPDLGDYRLEDQVGFAIRKASQRHTAIFSGRMNGNMTPTQWAALAKVAELGTVSQNQLGRDTAMDVATIKGVVDRLIKRKLVQVSADPGDGRRSLISLTAAGAAFVQAALPTAAAITAETLKSLSNSERNRLVDLLRKIG